MVNEFACAKVNLTLHVTGQRADGYHLLDSLVVFADIGDEITVSADEHLTLTIDGPQAAGLAADGSNLVLRAAQLLDHDRTAAIRLTKNLPIASGIGGGSADAAAALRALARFWDVPLPGLAEVATLGADVPACLSSQPLRLRGVGDELSPLPPLPHLDIVLVNPGVAVSTPQIFSRLRAKTNAPMAATLPDWPDAAAFCDWLATQRNDMLVPAAQLTPQITDVLTQLRRIGCLFAGMSGSGATCFGLFLNDGHSAKAAMAELSAAQPGWWCARGKIGTLNN